MAVQRGQIWQLGRHRLMCGDATSRDDVEALLDGVTADLTLTDPPYGINVINPGGGTIGAAGSLGRGEGLNRQKTPQQTNSGTIGGIAKNKAALELLGKGYSEHEYIREYAPVIGDENTEAAALNYKLVEEFSDNQVIFGGNHFTDFLPPSRGWLVWDKQNGRHNNFSDGELAWTSFDKILRIYEWRWSGMIRKGSRDLELKERIHPTQKPVGLLREILNDYSEENAVVLDCFAGSGSTLIACEASNRTCYAMELSLDYCEKIIERWETLTGEKASLVSLLSQGNSLS